MCKIDNEIVKVYTYIFMFPNIDILPSIVSIALLMSIYLLLTQAAEMDITYIDHRKYFTIHTFIKSSSRTP